MLEVQGMGGNWDCDEYMYGLYNGMEFMLSLIEERENLTSENHQTDFINTQAILYHAGG